MSHQVKMVVYDLSMGMARQLGMGLLGVQLDCLPHTGIIVFGQEYFYGGGIQRMPHENVVRQFGIRPMREQILGTTTKSPQEFHAFLDTIVHKYHPSTYDLFHNNCNHFSDEAAKFLLNGTGIPQDIVDLPQRVLSTPMGQMLAPAWSSLQQRMQNDFVPFNAAPPPSAPLSVQAQGLSPSPVSTAQPPVQQSRDYPRVPLVEALRRLGEECSAKEFVFALETIAKIMKNIINNPLEEKYRRISLTNEKFNASLGRFSYGVSCLLGVGFDLEATNTHVRMVPEESKWEKLVLSDKIVTTARRKAIKTLLEKSNCKSAEDAFGIVDPQDVLVKEVVSSMFSA